MFLQNILITITISFLLIYFFQKLFLNLKIIDRNKNNKVISFIAVRSAGIPIFFIFCFIYFFLSNDYLNFGINILFLISLLLVGFFDDINGLKPLKKFVFQFIIVICFVINNFSFSQNNLYTSALFIILLIFFFLWLINLFNFMDGIDGIASFQFIFIIANISFFIFLNNDYDLFKLLILYVFPIIIYLFFNFNNHAKFF